jgi:hypothetical protein
MHKPEEKASFGEYAKESRAERGRWSIEGDAGPIGPNPREDSKCKLISEFRMNLEFDTTLRNFTRRIRRDLDMWIFPKLFEASQGFSENKICHAMNATLGQLN